MNRNFEYMSRLAQVEGEEGLLPPSMRQTFESTKAHSSVDNVSKQDWYQTNNIHASQ